MKIPATPLQQIARITQGLVILVILATTAKFAWWVWFVA